MHVVLLMLLAKQQSLSVNLDLPGKEKNVVRATRKDPEQHQADG